MLRMDAWASHLTFPSSPSDKAGSIAGSGGATQGAEWKWTLLRMGHNVGLCPWRPRNVAVARGPGRFLRTLGLDTAPKSKFPLWRGEVF